VPPAIAAVPARAANKLLINFRALTR